MAAAQSARGQLVEHLEVQKARCRDAVHAQDRLAVSGLAHKAGQTVGGESAARGAMGRDDLSARHRPTLPSALVQTVQAGR